MNPAIDTAFEVVWTPAMEAALARAQQRQAPAEPDRRGRHIGLSKSDAVFAAVLSAGAEGRTQRAIRVRTGLGTQNVASALCRWVQRKRVVAVREPGCRKVYVAREYAEAQPCLF